MVRKGGLGQGATSTALASGKSGNLLERRYPSSGHSTRFATWEFSLRGFIDVRAIRSFREQATWCTYHLDLTIPSAFQHGIFSSTRHINASIAWAYPEDSPSARADSGIWRSMFRVQKLLPTCFRALTSANHSHFCLRPLGFGLVRKGRDTCLHSSHNPIVQINARAVLVIDFMWSRNAAVLTGLTAVTSVAGSHSEENLGPVRNGGRFAK